jgi:hypothetical protein
MCNDGINKNIKAPLNIIYYLIIVLSFDHVVFISNEHSYRTYLLH